MTANLRVAALGAALLLPLCGCVVETAPEAPRPATVVVQPAAPSTGTVVVQPQP